MVTSIESRLWLAVHLLYSNASQAFDVYQAVVLQSEHSIAKQDVFVVFSRLVQVYDKIPAIGSNLAFYEFEFEEIDQWKIIYKSSQKTQLIIFIGVLIFELKITDIAECVKLTAEKAQFLFQQIFKKLASTSQKLKYNEQLEFKKQNDNKISYLFTYENLVDYCLEQLSKDDTEKVKAGLQLYPMLQVAKEEYTRIITQIQNLKVQKERAIIPSDAKPNLKIVNNDVQSSQYLAKGLTKWQMRALISGASLVALLILIQPLSLMKKYSARENAVVLTEVDKVKQPTIAPLNTSVSSTATTAVVEQTPASATTIAATPSAKPAVVSPPVVAAKTPPPPSTTPVIETVPTPPVAAVAVVKEPTLAKEEGGLYRGTLQLAELKDNNEKIKAKMESLGASKAGEVELGWLKSPQMSYYHFTIPEKNIIEAEAYLKSLGQLQWKFEKHPRKVAAGFRRFIIEVRQN